MQQEKLFPNRKETDRTKKDNSHRKTDPTHLPVSDPPVPNRAHTEMRTEFPPEVPNKPPKEL